VESSPYWQAVTKAGVAKEVEIAGGWRDRSWAVCKYDARWAGEPATIFGGVARHSAPPYVRIVVLAARDDAVAGAELIASWEAVLELAGA